MTPVGPEQTDAELARQLLGRGGQTTALLEDQFPEILRPDIHRAGPESIPDRAEECYKMRREFFPVGHNQPPPMPLGSRASSVKACFHGLGVDDTVRLSEIGQAADADSALQTKKSAYPNPNSLKQVADPSPVISQRLQAIGAATTGTVFRSLNLLGVVLFQILHWGERSRAYDLHKLHLPEALALLNPPFERPAVVPSGRLTPSNPQRILTLSQDISRHSTAHREKTRSHFHRFSRERTALL
jgi:hypothetical protein